MTAIITVCYDNHYDKHDNYDKYNSRYDNSSNTWEKRHCH